MNKLYIIFSSDISFIGGMQMYTAGKAKYLQQRGWKVFVFFAGPREGKSAIPYLTQYVQSGGGMYFLNMPLYKLKRYEQNFYLNEMLQRLGKISFDEYETIIESHDDVQSYWAELLAEKIGARHFMICCNEIYRPTPALPNKTYADNLDFFYFKWRRNELVGNSTVLKKLFNGYKNVKAPLTEIPWVVREQDAVQDVAFPIEQVKKLDWNICHIGRESKDYVPFVIEGVGELARRHPDKKIQLIMVGKINYRTNLLRQTFKNLSNVSVLLLGDMVPIPRILFSKVDVVCAISQSARFAANENVLTICGCANDPAKTPGVLGYDTTEQVYGKGTFSYVEAFERVLVKRLYDGKKYSLPKLRPAEEYYDKFWTIVRNAAPVKEYYTQRISQERIRTWTAIFPFGAIAHGARIIFFGENDITKDYRRQIESQQNSSVEFGRDYVKNFKPQPYCEIVATVDERPDEFDDTVVGVERLKTRDYDAVVICTAPQHAQAAYDKIAAVVPDMVGKVIYNFNILSV